MRVRQARIDDAQAIAEVHVRTWQSAYRDVIDRKHLDSLSVEQRAGQWRRRLRGEERPERHQQSSWIAVSEEDSGGVDGFVSWSCFPGGSEAKAEVLALYVLESAQGKGRGRALISEVRRSVGPVSLLFAWTLADGPARGFYEALGGVLIDRGDYETGGKSYPSVCYRIPV